MHAIKKQRGMTFWGWLVVLAILGVAALVGIKLFPKYYDFWSVKSIVDQIAAEQYPVPPKAKQVWNKMYKYLDVNYITYIKPEHLKVKKEKDGAHIIIDYEVREHILGNVDAVLSFRHEAVAK